MKILSITLFAIITISNVYSQDFEGYILYKYQFLDALGNDITPEMGKVRGFEQNYYINASNYKGTDEKGQLSQLYNSETNMYYYQIGTQIKSIPATLEYPKKFSSKNTDDTLTISGYECKSIVITTESGQTKYYFSENIALDYDKFKQHRFGNWNNYMKSTNGAIPLKYIVKMKDYTWIAVAEKIEFQELDNSIFTVKKNISNKK